MNYRPKADNLSLWDTWMFNDLDGKRMHLYFLANRNNSGWEWVGHAISDDLIHWNDLPDIQVRRPDDTYDVGCVGTGMVFKSPSGEFMMSYTADLAGSRQRIAFLHSSDLINWEKRWQEPVIAAESPYYETDGAVCINATPAFRDAYIHKVNGRYEALVGAHTTKGPALLRGCIARYAADDDQLRQWVAMPPLIGPGVSSLMEVPEHFQIGDRHYVLWSNLSIFGVPRDTPARRACGGTFYAMADNYEGPYSAPENNLLIGSSGLPQSYVGRTILWGGERLLYHHTFGPESSLGFPKRIIQQDDGTLALGYWPGLESTRTEALPLALDNLELTGENLKAGEWTSSAPGRLSGKVEGGGSAALLPGEYENVHIRCDVTAHSCARFGVILRDPGKMNDVWGKDLTGFGVALQGDLKHNEWHFGKAAHCWASSIPAIETIHENLELGRTYRLDIIVRDIYFEAYVDGVWKFTRIINEHSSTGKIGFYVEDGAVSFDGICAWALEPMSNPA